MTDHHMVTYTSGGHAYTFQRLDMDTALPIFVTLTPLFLPLAGIIGDEIQSGSGSAEATLWTSLTASLAHNMQDPNVLLLCKDVIKTLYKDGQEVNISDEFRGRFDEYVDLLCLAVQENFLKFFLKKLAAAGFEVSSIQDLKGLVASMLKAPSKESKSPKKPTAGSKKKTS